MVAGKIFLNRKLIILLKKFLFFKSRLCFFWFSYKILSMIWFLSLLKQQNIILVVCQKYFSEMCIYWRPDKYIRYLKPCFNFLQCTFKTDTKLSTWNFVFETLIVTVLICLAILNLVCGVFSCLHWSISVERDLHTFHFTFTLCCGLVSIFTLYCLGVISVKYLELQLYLIWWAS